VKLSDRGWLFCVKAVFANIHIVLRIHINKYKIYYTSQTQLSIIYYVECQINDYMFQPFLFNIGHHQVNTVIKEGRTKHTMSCTELRQVL